MEKAGITNYHYLRLTDLGYVKGKTPANQTTIDKIFDDIKEMC